MCFISSHPVHHRRSCTSCPSSLRLMNCTSSPSTSALRASPGMNAAERRPCDHAHAVSGIHLTLQMNKAYHCHLSSTDFRAVLFFSPGRSPSCYDHEIIMMNHVYKERFPKVWAYNKFLQPCLAIYYLTHYQTNTFPCHCRPQLRWRNGFRTSSAATLRRASSLWQMVCSALPTTR